MTLEEAETEIRLAVKDGYLKGLPKQVIDRKVKEIITKALKSLKILALKEVSAQSLITFYNKQWKEIQTLMRGDGLALAMVIGIAQGKKPEKGVKYLQEKGHFPNGIPTYGVPLKKYMQDYLQNDVKKVMARLAETQPLDPEDTRKISLRARAELEVRYQSNADSVDNLKKSGVKLVIASTHADCSERCAPYQGRVYSLDGTSGTTEDGRKFVPLEVATDIYYTTKAGRTYKNGLIYGFNCRHYLIPYEKGFVFPKPDKEAEKREYAITLRQRQLERNVLMWKTRAVESLTSEEYKKARAKARLWDKEYMRFSKENNRAYYPSRTKIL